MDTSTKLKFFSYVLLFVFSGVDKAWYINIGCNIMEFLNKKLLFKNIFVWTK